jgi:hypothetical protein
LTDAKEVALMQLQLLDLPSQLLGRVQGTYTPVVSRGVRSDKPAREVVRELGERPTLPGERQRLWRQKTAFFRYLEKACL